jgi:hypothetical protein
MAPKYDGDDGRICTDPSTKVSKNDDSNPNEHIPNPDQSASLDENPELKYGTALLRLLIGLWNLRIDHPDEDILILPNDVTAAFHRILYHLSMMIVFASVFEEYLCVPAGSIFGSKSSPAYYMQPGELRAWLSGAFRFLGARTELTDRSYLSAFPTDKETRNGLPLLRPRRTL